MQLQAARSREGGMVAGQDGQDALLDKQPSRCCWLYPERFPALEPDVPHAGGTVPLGS